MPTNGNRPDKGAAYSVGIPSSVAESSRHPAQAQAEIAGTATFVLRLQARPGVASIRALRWLLKVLARQHGFRCIDVREARGRAS